MWADVPGAECARLDERRAHVHRVDALDARGVALGTRGAHAVVPLDRITRVRVLSAPERAPLVMRRISRT
ncbi:hypothetical protein [Nocardioides pacificus]